MTVTPPPADSPKGIIARVSGHIVVLTGLVAAVGGVLATASGGVQGVVDFFQAGDQTTSQISALDERLRLIEKAEKERLTAAEKDKAEAGRLAREIEKQIEAGQRSGSDVVGLQVRLRDVELRLERLGAQIDFLREHRL